MEVGVSKAPEGAKLGEFKRGQSACSAETVGKVSLDTAGHPTLCPVAQLVERQAVNLNAAGSSPAGAV